MWFCRTSMKNIRLPIPAADFLQTKQLLTTMKNSLVNSKLTAFAAAVLLCCSVLFINSKAWAQCPPGPNWTGPYEISETIQECSFVIYYCVDWYHG